MELVNSDFTNKTQEESTSTTFNSVSVDASEVSNAVLKRLIEEVKYESQNNILAYDRAHNRHNRGR